MEDEEYKERPVWRTILAIAFGLFAIVRFGILCHKMNSRPANDGVKINFNESDFQAMPPQSSTISKKAFNKRLYQDYQLLNQLSPSQLKASYITKLTKDSLVGLNVNIWLKINKGSLFQNTHDDSLKFAFKTPKNLNVFVHDFESKFAVNTTFKKLKSGNKIKKYRDFLKLSKNTKLVSYSIIQAGVQFKGVAYAFNEGDYYMFIEFESSILPQMELEHQALSYISKHIKGKK
ncbi:hypothetical protein [Pedobacter sp. GR22-10]|uniref:hypothetical protein n=1 Tax=Pedobacter sp. GR22-10 TaxID=2994472 RepID=UPI0022459B44|nr:hypothetical protein [Pedobacter sp. GR22-10]MCX2429814.1 hypothetical protein [Pedobacter sp. GR22-10]